MYINKSAVKYINYICRTHIQRGLFSTTFINQQNTIAKESREVTDDYRGNTSQLTEDLKSGKINISTKVRKQLPQRKPLAKEFFIGAVDTELLAYPEAIEKDDLNKLNNELKSSMNYFGVTLDSAKIETTRTIPNDVITDLKDLNLFGTNIPQVLGGREYFTTENSLASETEASDLNIALQLNVHRLISQLILEYGTDSIKRKYLPKLANGEMLGTVAVYEQQPSDDGTFKTSATLRSDEKCFVLNGAKSFVVNGPDANLYLVLASTFGDTREGDTSRGSSVFLVEADSMNIVKSTADLTFGCRAVKQSTVTFNNVEVPKDNILGNINDGIEIGQALLKYGRIQGSVLSTVTMQRILKEATEFAIENKVVGTPIMNTELVQNRLASAATSTYATESMVYLTAGLVDIYTKQDVDVESAMLQVYANVNLFKIAGEMLFLRGPDALHANQSNEISFRNASHLLTGGEQIDALKMFIGLSGLQHAGLNIHDTIKKVRNPLFHPGFILSKMFDRKNLDSPKLTLKLNEYLHPSLDPAAHFLEQSVVRLQIATEVLLSRYGPQVIDKQAEVKRLADAAILTYAMFATIARASRSYCIGLRHADYEMLTANVFALDTAEQIKLLVSEIAKGPFVTNDANLQKIAKQMFKSRGYFYVHPTTHNL